MNKMKPDVGVGGWVGEGWLGIRVLFASKAGMHFHNAQRIGLALSYCFFNVKT